MDDSKIIELYFERDDRAIKETQIKYGKLCHKIAYNILNNYEDSEECVNDTYVGVWNAIPPARPNNFMSFVCKITRNLSLKRLEFMKREKRSADVLVSIHELEGVLTVIRCPVKPQVQRKTALTGRAVATYFLIYL